MGSVDSGLSICLPGRVQHHLASVNLRKWMSGEAVIRVELLYGVPQAVFQRFFISKCLSCPPLSLLPYQEISMIVFKFATGLKLGPQEFRFASLSNLFEFPLKTATLDQKTKLPSMLHLGLGLCSSANYMKVFPIRKSCTRQSTVMYFPVLWFSNVE